MPEGLKWSSPAHPLFQKSSSAHIYHSCHKGQPGQFKQCGLVITGQNITRQYFCMNFHEKLCNTTQCHTMHSNFTKRTRVLWTHFFPPVCSSEEQQHLHCYWSNDWCTKMRGGMQCINMKYASGRAIVMQHCHEMVRKMQVNAIRSLLQFHWSDLVKCNPSVCFSKYGNKTSRKFIGVSSSSISHHWLFICYWGKWKEMRLLIE